ncbi:O-antigen translocase [Azohydromonas aeria]|uniref:O-antigen translocase n=1 Tax=Azohydromonas aeria TaxID=2590212 RepID=UPI0012F91811|nr:O-antigen translocase [Azohydromonas aeria]
MAEDTAVAAATPGAPGALAQPVPEATRRRHSYRDILSSSALIGGSTAITIVIGIVRTKAMALMLGPAGYGVMGAYLQIGELARGVAQMGLAGSGVRQIADATASGDTARIGRTVQVLRLVSLACALIGAVLLAALSAPIAAFTFGQEGHAGGVALLSLALFFTVVAGSQGALLQGMRRIGDMARIAILGGLLGTAIGVPLVYFLGEAGLAPTLVAMAAASLATSWWYSRRIDVAAPALDWAGYRSEAAALLRLGMAFMISGLLMNGAAYAVRTIVLRQAGLDAAGAYFAAWTLGGLYTGFILQALGTDFYPRLVGVIQDPAQCNRLVNEQTRVSLLLAVPGVLATITLAPLVIALFYSSSFTAAVDVLRWICLGMAVRVLTWPVGYIVVARNVQKLFIAIEVGWAVVNVALTWWCVEAFGVNGAGMAFLGANLLHALALRPIARRLSGFAWSAENRRTALGSFALVGATFAATQYLPPMAALALGLTATLASCWLSVRTLTLLLEPQDLPRPLQRILKFRRAPESL